MALWSYRGTRRWLTESGATLFLKAAAVIAPQRMEQKVGIAVLPFINFSGDPENEYFSDANGNNKSTGPSMPLENAQGKMMQYPNVS